MNFERFFILILTPISLACSKLDEAMIETSGDTTSAYIMPGPTDTNDESRCEIPSELFPENADASSLQMTLKINDESFQFDGNPSNTTGIFSFFEDEHMTDSNLGIMFDMNASHDFQNRDISISGNMVLRNDSSETQAVDLELKIPVISDGTQITTYSGNVSIVLSNGEITALNNQNLWTTFSSCDLFSRGALTLDTPITANEFQFINIGSYSFGGGNSPNIAGESIVKEMGFRLRFSLSAGAFVSLTSFVGAHRELAP